MRPRDSDRLLQLALCIGCAAVYAPVVGHGFVDLDDPRYVPENAWVRVGLTLDGVRMAFGGFTMSNWHPLTWISHMLDVSLFGVEPGWHHVVNVVFHAANACLLFVALTRATAGREASEGDGAAAWWLSAWVAGAFALHPAHVESVAWIAERKDVLSTFFALTALLSWLRYLEAPSPRRYAGVGLLLAASLMAKPTLVTFPFVLLLLDVWPLRRVGESTPLRSFGRLCVEKLPLLGLGALISIVAIAAQRSGGALQSFEVVPLDERLLSLPIAYLRYLQMAVWPTGLAVFYPRFSPEWLATSRVFAAGALLLFITALASWQWQKRRPALIVGWLWFLGTLVPTIGLVQVGDQSHADRYTYFPYVGLSIALAWGVQAAWPRAQARLLGVLGLAALVACGLAAHVQVGVWTDSFSLWQRALAVTPPNAMTHTHLAALHLAADALDPARTHALRAAELAPEQPVPHHNLGRVHARRGDEQLALASYARALEVDPDFAPSRLGLADQLRKSGRHAEAVEAFDRALRASPDLWRTPGIDRGYAVSLYLERATGQRSFEGTAADYRRALAANPEFGAAGNDLIWILATAPEATTAHAAEALQLAVRFIGRDASARQLDTLAAAQAAAGRYDAAVTTAERAAARAARDGDRELVPQIDARLELYRADEPYRDPSLSVPAP